MRDFLVDLLTAFGHRVESAGNGSEALTLLTERSFAPILTALHMPEMDGEALYQKIAQTWPHLASRGVFVTSGVPSGDLDVMRRMSRRVGFIVPIVALAFFLVGCPKRAATPAMPTTAAPASPEPAPTSPEPAPAAPVAPPPQEFRAHEGLRDVHFALGKSEVLKADAAALDATAAWLTQNPHWLVLIEGYTDDRGTKDQNLAVSERRARSVMSYLVTEGVEPDRISIAWYGTDRPLCTEKSEGCRAKNRRAHFLVRER